MKSKIILYCIVAIVSMSSTSCLKNFWKINVQNCKKCPQPMVSKDFVDYYLFEEGSEWEYNVYDTLGAFLFVGKSISERIEIKIELNPNSYHYSTNDTLYTYVKMSNNLNSMYDSSYASYSPKAIYVSNNPIYTLNATVFAGIALSPYAGDVYLGYNNEIDSIKYAGGAIDKILINQLDTFVVEGVKYNDVKKNEVFSRKTKEFKIIYFANRIGIIQLERNDGITIKLNNYSVTPLSDTRPELFE